MKQQHSHPTRPATPRAIRRAPTLLGVAPCAQAPRVLESRTGYRTLVSRVAGNARTREAVRIDRVERVGK